MEGWIKLHRQLSEKAFYKKDSEKVHLWLHLLIKANRKTREELFNNKPIICKAGQFTTGRKQLSSETGISESKIQRLLTYFEKTEQQIEQQTSSVNRLISIKNWKDYQITEQPIEQQPNSDRTTSEQQANTLQDSKEEKTYKNTLLSKLKSSDVENSDHLEITLSFYELFKKNLIELNLSTSTIEKSKGNWIDHIRLMIETDKRTKEELREIWQFLQKDEFWKQNIRSTKKLREKFETLLIKSRSNEKVKSRGQQGGVTNEELANVIAEEFGTDS